MTAPPRRFEALARHLEALASEPRLELLHALRTPRALHELRVGASLSRGEENPDRALSRQAVSRHLEQLQELGLVQRLPAEGRGRAEAYVLNHERLFAMVDEIRGLARLRATAALGPGETMARDEPRSARLPGGPRLFLAYGRDDGIAFALEGPVGARWRIGRGPGCEVRLDYDPYSSAENTAVARAAGGFTVEDLGSRNGTLLNGDPLPKDRPVPLRPGDVLTVGRSVLVFQA